MTVGIYAGSFDPFTYGHSSIVHDALKFCDQVRIVIGINPTKKPLFSVEERINFIKIATADFKRDIVVESFTGMMIDYAESVPPIRNPSKLLIRGLRSALDFEYESSITLINQKLNPSIQTVFLLSDPSISMISSSMVKEVAGYKHDVRAFVHPEVAKALAEKFGHD